MADRVVSVRLKIEMDEARRNSRAVSQSLLGVASAAQTAGNSGQHLKKIASAARETTAAVAGIGAVAAGGMTALGVSTLKTGISYNTLEQTSRAALKTVLGSASAATNQMEQLREFGKSSPFPRQVWISAQQQLLAFGMTAEKVIPTLSAIQDAVAAAGGSSQQISEVTAILARIQSTGKVTAEELNELGYRGIDAAKLVGEAMGKTAGEVRADITSQAISGQQFLDTLTASMSSHFAGAAAGVKQTWTGAVDRVKGAIRDIGSILATPLVDPNGGGAAVEWANEVADALRALEARLQPVMSAFADRAEPIFDAVSDKLERLAYWIKTADFSAMWQKIQPMLPTLAAVTAGFTTMGAKSLPILDRVLAGVKPLPVALIAAAAASPQLRGALVDLLSAAEPLLQAAAQLSSTLATALGPALSAIAALLQPVIAVVGFLADRFADLPSLIQMVVVGFAAWKALGIGSWLVQNVGLIRAFNDQMKVQAALAVMSGQQVGTMGAAYSVAATRVSAAGKAVTASAAGIRGAMASAATFMAGPWGAAVGLGVTALGLFASAQDDAKGSTEDFTVALDENTGALSGSSVASIYKWVSAADSVTDNGAKIADVLKDMGVSANDLTGYLIGNADATSRVEAALRRVDDEASRNYYGVWLRDLRNKIRDRMGAEGAATGAAERYAGATDKVAGASASAAAATGGLASGLYMAGDAADSAATRAQQLQGALSGLFDAQFGYQKAADDFQGGLQSLKDAFAKNDKAASKSTDTTDRYGEALKRQQKIVKDTRKQLEDLAESQRNAEKDAAEAARNARQRALDEMFGKQFDVQSTLDAFRSGLAQAARDIAEGKKDKTRGITSLTGFSEGALANRERMRGLVQQAQAAIQAERDRGASAARIKQVTQSLAGQLTQSAKAWGMNADEVKSYTDAITSFGGLAGQKVVVDLRKVKAEFAEQRKEIHENSAEQMENARQSAASARQQTASGAAVDVHTAALTGNSKSALANREAMRAVVKQAQEELTQMHLNGAGKDEVRRRGVELARQLEREAIQLGFNREDVRQYTEMIHASAQEIARYPVLKARAETRAAMVTVTNFVKGVNREMAKIQKNFKIGVITGSEYINSSAGGKQFATNADGGYISGPGGPRDDKILSWLSNGEFVQQSAAVSYYGTDFMHQLNARRIPKDVLPGFKTGGEVGKVNPITLKYVAKHDPKQVAKTFKQLRTALGMEMPAYSPAMMLGGGVQRWAPLVLEALRLLRQPSSLLPNVLRRMNQESGGNPRAINLWDSNAMRGTPSMGLMQTILPTFNAYAGPYRNRGVWDPFANIYAGLNYAINRYGSLQYAMDKPGGYALGGLVDEPVRGSYARGTDYVPMDGLYRLHRGEAVIPADLNRALIAALSGRGAGGEVASGPVNLTATLVDADGSLLGRMHGVARQVVDSEGRNLLLTRGRRP